jgi:hypothetical protein
MEKLLKHVVFENQKAVDSFYIEQGLIESGESKASNTEETVVTFEYNGIEMNGNVEIYSYGYVTEHGDGYDEPITSDVSWGAELTLLDFYDADGGEIELSLKDYIDLQNKLNNEMQLNF